MEKPKYSALHRIQNNIRQKHAAELKGGRIIFLPLSVEYRLAEGWH
jgi:hypothetical protein